MSNRDRGRRGRRKSEDVKNRRERGERRKIKGTAWIFSTGADGWGTLTAVRNLLTAGRMRAALYIYIYIFSAKPNGECFSESRTCIDKHRGQVGASFEQFGSSKCGLHIYRIDWTLRPRGAVHLLKSLPLYRYAHVYADCMIPIFSIIYKFFIFIKKKWMLGIPDCCLCSQR